MIFLIKLINTVITSHIYLFFFPDENISVLLAAASYLVAQLYLTLCDPMDCSPPGSSVHGILQARILEW